MMNLSARSTDTEIQDWLHRKLLNIRNLDRLVQSSKFSDAWHHASEESRKKLIAAINFVQVHELRILMHAILFDELGCQSVRILRQLASKHGIKDYCRLSKDDLIYILTDKGISCESKRRKTNN